MDTSDRQASVEFGLWRNGQPEASLVVHSLWFRAGVPQEHVIHIPSRHSSAHQYRVRIRFEGELVQDWVSGEMWLEDHNAYPISTPRPCLIFLGVSDLPMTVTFPSLHAHPISQAGIWVVSTRLAYSTHRLSQVHFGMPRMEES